MESSREIKHENGQQNGIGPPLLLGFERVKQFLANLKNNETKFSKLQEKALRSLRRSIADYENSTKQLYESTDYGNLSNGHIFKSIYINILIMIDTLGRMDYIASLLGVDFGFDLMVVELQRFFAWQVGFDANSDVNLGSKSEIIKERLKAFMEWSTEGLQDSTREAGAHVSEKKNDIKEYKLKKTAYYNFLFQKNILTGKYPPSILRYYFIGIIAAQLCDNFIKVDNKNVNYINFDIRNHLNHIEKKLNSCQERIANYMNDNKESANNDCDPTLKHLKAVRIKLLAIKDYLKLYNENTARLSSLDTFSKELQKELDQIPQTDLSWSTLYRPLPNRKKQQSADTRLAFTASTSAASIAYDLAKEILKFHEPGQLYKAEELEEFEMILFSIILHMTAAMSETLAKCPTLQDNLEESRAKNLLALKIRQTIGKQGFLEISNSCTDCFDPSWTSHLEKFLPKDITFKIIDGGNARLCILTHKETNISVMLRPLMINGKDLASANTSLNVLLQIATPLCGEIGENYGFIPGFKYYPDRDDFQVFVLTECFDGVNAQITFEQYWQKISEFKKNNDEINARRTQEEFVTNFTRFVLQTLNFTAKIQKQGAYYSDPKPTNFLLVKDKDTTNINIHIGDGKSFVIDKNPKRKTYEVEEFLYTTKSFHTEASGYKNDKGIWCYDLKRLVFEALVISHFTVAVGSELKGLDQTDPTIVRSGEIFKILADFCESPYTLQNPFMKPIKEILSAVLKFYNHNYNSTIEDDKNKFIEPEPLEVLITQIKAIIAKRSNQVVENLKSSGQDEQSEETKKGPFGKEEIVRQTWKVGCK